MLNNRVSTVTALSALLVLAFAAFTVPSSSVHASGGDVVVAATTQGGSTAWTTLAQTAKQKRLSTKGMKAVRVSNPVPYIIAFAVIFTLIGFFIWVMLSTNPNKGKLPPVDRYEDDDY